MLNQFRILTTIVCFCCASFIPTITYAQADSSANILSSSSGVRTTTKKPKPITKQKSLGIRLNTDGWGIFFDKGKTISEDLKRIEQFHDIRYWQIEFGERKHSKEIKMYGWDANQQGDKQFILGKKNNFYSLKFTYGIQKLLSGKPYPRTVSTHLIAAGGVTLGLLKPYYIDAYVRVPGTNTFMLETIKYSDSTTESFLDPNLIIGGAGFSKGLGEIKFAPGVHLKSGVRFDYSKKPFSVAAIEIGGSFEFYTSKIELMAKNKSVPYFFNLYVSAQFGKRNR
jgi:hypothetical protein